MMGSKQRIFVDIDGTLAKWTPVKQFEELLEPGFYVSMEGNHTVLQGLAKFCESLKDSFDVYTLSAYLREAEFAKVEKNAWMDKHVPFISKRNRVFCYCDEEKNVAVPGGVRPDDILLDDYSKNLHEWQGIGIKLLNGINGTKGTWRGKTISMSLSPEAFAEELIRLAQKT